MISIAGGGASGKISTPMTVNSCASVPSGTFVAASTSPEAVCVSNGTDVYLIDGTTLVKTLTSGGGANSISFSGGSCTTCGVVVDSISGNAMISVATADGKGGYQILNLAAQTFSSVIPLGPNDGLAEHFAVFPLAPGFFLALSPTEGGITSGLDGPDYDILTIAPPTASSSGGDAIFDFSGRSV
ncbi:MAG: hypothetical protein ACRDOE_25250, partial [Streptosporangiaceae bacterium]